MTNRNITAVILAGGKSSRIGRNKAFLKIGNKPFIEILINKLRGLFQKIIISTKQPKEYKHLVTRITRTRRGRVQRIETNRTNKSKLSHIEIIKDRSDILSSLAGIYSALKKSRTKYIFVIAVDMPTIKSGLIKRLLASRSDAHERNAPYPKAYRHNGYDVVIPQTNKGLEPLCAIYSKKCLPFIERQIRNGNYKIIDFFDKVKVKTIRLNRNEIFNVNTIKDYQAIEKDPGKIPIKNIREVQGTPNVSKN